jgi:hypothetical protein
VPLVALEECFHVLGRHEPGVVAEVVEAAAQVMGADTSRHADEAGGRLASLAWSWRRESFWRSTMCATLVEADEVEGVLTDVDAEGGDGVFRQTRQGPGSCLCQPPLDAGVLRGAPPVHPINCPRRRASFALLQCQSALFEIV